MEMMDLFATNNLLFGLVVGMANIVQGLTGFAGSLLAMPAGMHLQGIDTARVAINTFGLMSSIIIFSKTYKTIDWKEAKKLALLMVTGMMGGMYLATVAKPQILLNIYATFIIIVALKEMFYKGPLDFNDAALVGIVLTAGLFQGLFVSGGPFLVIYVTKKLKNKEQMRGTLGFIWLFLNSYMMITQIISGQFTPEAMTATAIGIPCVFLGVMIGDKLSKKIDKEKFLKFVYVLLILSGLSLY